ncbi:MAG: hypothetical protein OXE05_06115 [Chloroflexi bacterium]|nr:hypothetical protein [Chloroflexota bacterium]
MSTTPTIGTYQEKSLHAALKDWYAAPGDQAEQPVDGYVIDLIRGDELIEIQTRNFSAIKRKLAALLPQHAVRLVHPIPAQKWIVRLDGDGATVLSRRRSPKRGTVLDVFDELVSIPHLVTRPQFSLEVLLVEVEETRQQDGRGSWRRRGWSIHDQVLVGITSQHRFHGPADFAGLLPATLPEPFTSSRLAARLGVRHGQGQKIAYCLRHMGAIEIVGKQGNAYQYRRAVVPIPNPSA